MTTTDQPQPSEASQSASVAPVMTQRQVMQALSGLLLGMFVAILSSTIVSNALPHIVADLGGSQSSYTWVVTSTLLAMTASTPLWGKLSDLYDKKRLVQTALVIFVTGSVLAGLAHGTGLLIAMRAVQGVGTGGMVALSQIVLASMIPPRERGRYNGYLGAVFAVATVAGPLIGGVITDTSWLGWRWCFYVGVPIAAVALGVLQRTLQLPVGDGGKKVDWLGAALITSAVSLLLVWVTLAGDSFAWNSWQTYAMIGGSVTLAVLFAVTETKAADPVIPLRLFRNRTIALASSVSFFVGAAMFAATVYLSQYFQLALGESATMAGLMTVPMIAGLFLASTVSGRFITATGLWKAWLVTGGILLTAGLALLARLHHDTPYWQVACAMAFTGLGLGMSMQNLVLAAQNQTDGTDLGATSSLVAFTRSLGGTIGVSALGALLSSRVTHYLADGLTRIGAPAGGSDTQGAVPDVSKLREPLRTVVTSAYGDGIADLFLFAAPAALLGLVVTLFIRETALKDRTPEPGHPTTAPAEGQA
ncbi:MFS transporter [Streptomyces sp. NBC_01352]|uniref:MDR family MFS transporter n=2 Tax=Streptomyces TaxID=1883 RepID=UPI00224E11CA|nr:MFS transporter [Streptomyces sp. NBC_01373]